MLPAKLAVMAGTRKGKSRAAESGAGAHCCGAGGRDARTPAGAGATGGYAMPPERRKKCVWRRGLIHRAVPVRKEAPAGGDIAAAGGSRRAVARRFSLGRRLLFGGVGG